MPPSLSPRESASSGRVGTALGPYRVMARRATRSELSPQSNPHHPGHIRSNPSAGTARASSTPPQRRRTRRRNHRPWPCRAVLTRGAGGAGGQRSGRPRSLVRSLAFPPLSPSRAAPGAPSPTTKAEPFTPAGKRRHFGQAAGEAETEEHAPGRGAWAADREPTRRPGDGTANVVVRRLDPLRRTG